MSGTFLNIDVEIRAGASLQPLADQLGGQVSVLHCGTDGADGHFLSFELSGADSTSDQPDTVARGLCAILEGLPAAARQYWDNAQDRVFDVGYEVTDDRQTGQPVFGPATMRRIADLGARLAISLYVPGEQAL